MTIRDSFSKAPGLDRVADTQQRQIEEFMRSLGGVELLQGRLIENVSVPASGLDFMVAHKLRRQIKGYLLVGSNYPLMVYDGSLSSTPDLFVNLRASYSGSPTNVLIDLWVF